MAFKQTPGRESFLKTGNGIPPTLMCGSPMKQEPVKGKKPATEIELTDRFNTGKAKMAEARKSINKVADLKSTQGINVDAATGKATAAPYEKRYDQGKKGQADRIMSGSNVVKEAKSAASGKFGKKDESLYNEFKRDSTATMNSRNKNAMQYNITSGAKSTNKATEKEKQILVNLGKAKKV